MIRFLLTCLIMLSFPPSVSAQLVIAGGGLEADTKDVWQAFIKQAKGDGDFVIVPSASGSPAQSGQSVVDTLLSYGVAKNRVTVAPLALLDDRITPDVDESDWRHNIDDPEVIEQLGEASAIWFTGGDQLRTTELFLPEGQESAALHAVRRAQKRGVPIGGTSAGAAIMSRSMIARGDTLTALTGSDSGEPLRIEDGLGFFPSGLVDQHFGERARLGRLAVALGRIEDQTQRIGFGIDENTALITKTDGTVSVAGTGYVTILDGRNANFREQDGRVQISGLMLHLMSASDQINLDSLSVTAAYWKSPTVGDEYVEAALPGGGGMAVQGQALQDVIGEGLIDNAESQSVERISFDASGRGVGYLFRQSEASSGFWGRGPDGSGRYTIANIAFDIIPVDLSMTTLSLATQP